jgi:hypothetical protein
LNERTLLAAGSVPASRLADTSPHTTVCLSQEPALRRGSLSIGVVSSDCCSIVYNSIHTAHSEYDSRTGVGSMCSKNTPKHIPMCSTHLLAAHVAKYCYKLPLRECSPTAGGCLLVPACLQASHLPGGHNTSMPPETPHPCLYTIFELFPRT